MNKTKLRYLVLLICGLLGTIQTAYADIPFTQIGYKLNINQSSAAGWSDVSYTSDGRQTVVWLENGNVYVKQRVKKQWHQLGQALNYYIGGKASVPVITADGNAVYVSWSEKKEGLPGERVYVKRWNGKSWSFVGTYLNVSWSGFGTAQTPAITVYQGAVFVAFIEQGKLYVKNWNGSEWEFVGGNSSLNVIGAPFDSTASRPSITYALNGSQVRLYVSWAETNPFYGNTVHVRVRYWNPGLANWQSLGGALNTNLSIGAGSPSIAVAVANGQYLPYVAFYEFTGGQYNTDLVVYHRVGNSWQMLGGQSLDVTSSLTTMSPSISLYQNRPVVAWSEHEQLNVIGPIPVFPGVTRDIYVAIWESDALAWEYSDDLKLYEDDFAFTSAPRIDTRNNKATITWVEGEPSDSKTWPIPVIVKEGTLPTIFGFGQ